MTSETMNCQTSETCAFFEALERRRTHALVQRDMAVIEELHALNYELITPTGKVFARREYLAAIAAAPFYTGWDATEVRVRVTAQMAVVRYKALLQFPSGRQLCCWHTDLYQIFAGTWQAVWSQATEIRPRAAQA